jgi:hypothetical protein
LGGNVILYDDNDKMIKTVLRYHILPDKRIMAFNPVYNYEQFRNYTPVEGDKIKSFFQEEDPSARKLCSRLTRLLPLYRAEYLADGLTRVGIDAEMLYKDFVYKEDQIELIIQHV